MMGTIVNAAAVAVGGLLGLVFKRGMKPALEESIHKALGIAVLVLGLNGIISAMITVSEDGRLSSSGEPVSYTHLGDRGAPRAGGPQAADPSAGPV